MESFDMGAQRLHQEKISDIINFQDKKEVFAGPVNKFRPTQDYVVVYRPKFNKITKSGIEKSKQQVEKEIADLPKAFEVASVGEKVDKSIVKPGQFILCNRADSSLVESDREGFDIAVCRMFDIIGVFDGI